MKYIKMFWIDFKNGILKNVLLFLCPMILALFTFWDAWNRIHGVKEINLSLAAYGDYWFYVYGGMQKYVPGPGNTFQVPIIWMVVFILPAFLLLNYPVKDMQHMGTQMNSLVVIQMYVECFSNSVVPCSFGRHPFGAVFRL